ncbi:MAG: 16S rRNA (adenine(1518)-N(6)/adenine(1519)-N(6))-dimethyltransferase RsmA [Kineosporiaceae bacterium]
MSDAAPPQPAVPLPLLGAAEVRELAEALGVRPTKTLGQNFVHDANTVRRIARLAEVGPGDQVVEVGPGLGSLTLALLETGADVVAVEIDPALAAALAPTVAARAPEAGARLTVVHADALRVTELPLDPGRRQVMVANLPYNVAVPVLLTFLERFPGLAGGLVMVQAEVADRLAARPGEQAYGVPSVKASWYADVRRAGHVPRQVFWPVPNVESGLVAWTRRAHALPDGVGAEVSREQVFACVDAAFAQRRKTLRSALARWAGSPADAERICRSAGVDPGARGETLDVAAYVALARAAGLPRD